MGLEWEAETRDRKTQNGAVAHKLIILFPIPCSLFPVLYILERKGSE